jgi:hypothetical protein
MKPNARPRLSTALCAVVLALLSFAAPVLADTVTPKAKAVHGVVVRADDSTDSAQVGALSPGESAELIETVGAWRNVRLANGTTGFVSSAWTDVVQGEAAAPTPAPTPTPTAGPTPASPNTPAPLLAAGEPVNWWFVFKFNTGSFPECGTNVQQHCPFGGTAHDYQNKGGYSQQFVYASDKDPTLHQGTNCVGDTTDDPVGATFDEVYNGNFFYVVWNDQFYNDPEINGCDKSCSGPWGHSKGLVAWNDAGNGLVMQVSTPSWPASGSAQSPRPGDGNTLGCIDDDDNILVSQHFFAARLAKDDLTTVLRALQTASVVTDPTNRQIVRNGGPGDVQALVSGLGKKSTTTSVVMAPLHAANLTLIAKPSNLNVPPWQLVSAELGGVPLRTATWWANPKIPSTTAGTAIACWKTSLGTPGAVEIAATGQWNGTSLGLEGTASAKGNHAKIGVSTDSTHHYAIFGDMNQQGALSGNCASSQNGRGGLFYAVDNQVLRDAVAELISGETAPQN